MSIDNSRSLDRLPDLSIRASKYSLSSSRVGILIIAMEIKIGNRKIIIVFFNDFEQRKI